jgi:thymidine kinase
MNDLKNSKNFKNFSNHENLVDDESNDSIESEISIIDKVDKIIDIDMSIIDDNSDNESVTNNIKYNSLNTSPDQSTNMNMNMNMNMNKNITNSNGYLKIVTGCMFSGKTSYIIRECKKWQSIGKNVLMINYDLDKRYSDKNQVVSHDKFKIDCIMVNDLDIDVSEYDVILINEAQFFSQLKDHVNIWCDELKKIVVVSGLDGDYLRGKFGEVLDLIPSCDEFIKLKAYCSMCKDGTDAIFTWKIHNNNDIKNIIDIGVHNYTPLCRKHYNIQKSNLKMKLI